MGVRNKGSIFAPTTSSLSGNLETDSGCLSNTPETYLFVVVVVFFFFLLLWVFLFAFNIPYCSFC